MFYNWKIMKHLSYFFARYSASEMHLYTTDCNINISLNYFSCSEMPAIMMLIYILMSIMRETYVYFLNIITQENHNSY